MAHWKTGFPPPEPLPERIDGIVVLGGAVSLAKSASRGQPTVNSNAERLTTFVTLGKRYPGARLLYTGGFRGLSEPPIREGSVASELFVDLGLKDGRLEIDNSARNTIDNAANALEMAKPKQGEVWLLITSARHMPRAMGVFRLAGWPMIVPYPVGYLTVQTSRPRLRLNLKDGLSQLRVAQHEWIGLVVYRLMGASAELISGGPDEVHVATTRMRCGTTREARDIAQRMGLNASMRGQMILTKVLIGIIVAAQFYAHTVEAGEHDKGFASWRDTLRSEALSQGIRAESFDAAFAGVSPIPRVIELDRRQPEFTMTFDQYIGRVITQKRIQEGRQKFAENRSLLAEVGKKYGVQPRFIVALWGIESGFGRHTGGFPVIASLATLAFDGRRSTFFRKELMISLKILDQGHISPDRMKGSWAGAMGQNQFMPSSFARHAIDYDGDGRRDIWTSKPDIFASTANYLANAGWRDDITWGRAVRLSEDFDISLAGRSTKKLIGEWQKLGVRRADGTDLPTRRLVSSIVLPDKGKRHPAFMVYDNFETILKWNRSDFFAVAVGYIADRIAER